MILYPPKNFDVNEIFILLSIIITWILMLKLPRHISPLTILLLWTFNIFHAVIADVTIGVNPYDLYDTVDRNSYEIFDFLMHFLGYPPYAYLALNFYAARRPKGLKLLSFIVTCALITTLMEWIALLLNVFTYNDWTLYLSFIVYVVVYTLNILLFLFIEKIFSSRSISTHKSS